MWLYLIPVYIVLAVLLVLGIFALLSRIRGGRYLRPVVQFLAKVPLFRRLMERATKAAIERQNPDLANAIKKLERAGAHKDPMRAQKAMSQLSASERRAWLQAAASEPTPASNRAERRKRKQLGGR
ncbi:MAG TPA: hypothetical protein VH306_05545 [Gaiellaceae bacterium]